MIYMWFTGKNYYKLAVEKDRDVYENQADGGTSCAMNVYGGAEVPVGPCVRTSLRNNFGR